MANLPCWLPEQANHCDKVHLQAAGSKVGFKKFNSAHSFRVHVQVEVGPKSQVQTPSLAEFPKKHTINRLQRFKAAARIN